jgi:tetratricopeptide (TPR) repeat protein
LPAEDAFWAAIHYGGPPAPALVELGEIALWRKQYDRAAELLRRALSHNPGDALALTDLAVALRLRGSTKQARQAVQQALATTSLLPYALAEAWRSAGTTREGALASSPWIRWRKSIVPDEQSYLDVAAWYRNLGDLASAQALLEAALRELPNVSPMTYYYLASSARQQGRTSHAEELAAKAARAPLAGVFPQRLADAAVLFEACQTQADDSHAAYLLGDFLFAHARYDAAADFWRRASEAGFDDPVLHRNLGLYFWRVKKDLLSAAKHYERALRRAPSDYQLYLDLDQIYFQSGDREARGRLFRAAPAQVLARDALRVRRALFLIQGGRYDEALEALADHRFIPGEYEIIVRQVFVLANLRKGREKLRAGDYAAAEAAFRRALEYPRNFNIGKPARPDDQEALYWLGEALQASGKTDGARAAWQQAVGDETPATGAARVFQALAMRRLGRSPDAESILASLAEGASKEMASSLDLYVAGVADRLQNREPEARDNFRRALDLDPFFWQARLELERSGDAR